MIYKQFDKCPFCETDHFLAGPRGGLSQNFKCKHCGATFNYMGPFGVELLAGPQLIDGNFFYTKEREHGRCNDKN